MKEFRIHAPEIYVPEDTYTLSKAEIAVIHALCFYAPDGITVWADKTRAKLKEQFRFHKAIGIYKVWKE